MPTASPTHSDRLARARALATQGLLLAKDFRAHADAPGEVRLSLVNLTQLMKAMLAGDAKAAQAELDRQLDVLEAAFKKIGGWESKKSVDACDGMGHVRPAYGALYSHLLLRALAFAHPTTRESVCEHNKAAEVGERCFALLSGTKIGYWRRGEPDDVAMIPWLNLNSADMAVALSMAPSTQADNCLEALPPEGALHAQAAGDTTDAWVYRELTALHALDRLARITGSQALAKRVENACRYHLQNTQPDYTTYQPWVLLAFLRLDETLPMVDQQLHDVTAHFALEGEAGAAVAALLLADAALECGASAPL